jgi:hypothetical protein
MNSACVLEHYPPVKLYGYHNSGLYFPRPERLQRSMDEWPLSDPHDVTFQESYYSHFNNIQPCSRRLLAHHPSREYSFPIGVFSWILIQRSGKPVSTYCSHETRDLSCKVSRNRARLLVGLHPWQWEQRASWGSSVRLYRKLDAFRFQ